MNKRGFAISIVLYAVVFIIITIFYILLGIIKARYSVNGNFKNNVSSNLNGIEHMYTKLDRDDPVTVLKIDPNGGSVQINGSTITSITSVVNYAGETMMIPDAIRTDVDETISGEVIVSYNANGGDSTPSNLIVQAITTISYTFDTWSSRGQCGSFENGIYTFPSIYGYECTKVAAWTPNADVHANTNVTLAAAPTRRGFRFTGWQSSLDNEIYAAGSNYTVTKNTVMTAQWESEVWAKDVEYIKSINDVNCETVQCALEEIDKMVN